ncbi:hypothetical protein N7462_005084 [Penicillium macrosclerotiorum]|uniref:uncharacterized protein n=1 Tax=Penicillium macrosclerotiorum TaxID=303699 RepID=UPI002548DCC2|nr:uncharacterized protein N7462_005084 [Penicillium macrosclerotiorum]KAJ5690692.1 hypothetical protein N7462_005084 [Penicillium macrosclerotiorum]
MAAPLWLQFTGQQPKRKRAELACIACHSKKIRCDLQSRGGQGYKNCTKCAATGKDCRTRPSRRGRPSVATAPALTPPDSNSSGRTGSSYQSLSRKDSTQIPNVTSQDDCNTTRHNTTFSDDNDQLGFSGNILQGVSLATVQSEVTGNSGLDGWSPISHGVSKTLSCENQNRNIPTVSNDSPATQRTEDHSEHNDSYPVGHVFLPELQTNARDQERLLAERLPDVPSLPNPDLQQSFAETYFEYCHPWCPVLDRSIIFDELSRSPLLVNALAVVGSHIQPPMILHDGPAVYYDRARKSFYNDEESDVMTSLKAISLFYWWSPRPPTILHRHSSWWWTSVVIRHCQQLGIYREPALEHPLRQQIDLSLRRRIWWTAFARERLTALCQSKPCVIDPDDCTLSEPTLEDFPNPQDKEGGEIFIYWVRLCAIIGKVAKYLARTNDSASFLFPASLARELVHWVQSLPSHLQLPINLDRTTRFNRNVHQLHLPYLAVIIIIHLKRSSSTQPLPQVYPPAILAATCTARLMRDILSRGDTRFLMAITGWYCGTAFIALLQALRIESLAKFANEDLDILTLAVDQLRKMWPTAGVFYSGFERIRPSAGNSDLEDVDRPSGPELGVGDGTGYMEMSDGIDWTAYFPFATPETSEVASRLLVPPTEELFFDNDIFTNTMLQFQDLFEPCDTLSEVNLFM